MSKKPTDAPTEELIKKQAERLLTLPANPGNSTEIARAIARHCKTGYHVKSVVQYLLDNEQFFPTPSAVRDAAEMLPSEQPPKYREANPLCGECSGTGFIHCVRGGYEGAAVCCCRKVGV